MERLETSDTLKMVAHDREVSYVNKLLVVLVVIAILLSSVALIVAFISLSRQDDGMSIFTGPGTGQGLTAKDERIWNIAIGHGASNGIYIDQQSGKLKGFQIDMVNAVCQLANKNCRLVYDVWQRCWESEKGQLPRGGEGLMNGWYDACAAWIKSQERARTFQFSKSWQRPVNYHFIVKTGNPRQFNPRDVTNMTFGFVDGFISDEFCVARQTTIKGSTLSISQIQHFPQRSDLFNAVLSGEVDVALEHTIPPPGLTRLEEPVIGCSLDNAGRGLMLRMDNSLLEWWDPALERLIQTSEYRQICQNLKDEHGHMPGKDPKKGRLYWILAISSNIKDFIRL